MLQTIIIFIFIIASLKVSLLHSLNTTKHKAKLKFRAKTSIKSSTKSSNGKIKWRGVRQETLQVAETILPRDGKKLLLISQRSSDQAAKRRYHVSNQDAIRESITQAEELDELLKIQREKSLMQVEPAELAEQTEGQQQTDKIKDIKDIRQTKKKPGRPTNPEFTKNKYLEINKEDHRGHRLKDHGLSSHTIIDFETETSGSSVFSSRYQWNLEITRDLIE